MFDKYKELAKQCASCKEVDELLKVVDEDYSITDWQHAYIELRAIESAYACKPR